MGRQDLSAHAQRAGLQAAGAAVGHGPAPASELRGGQPELAAVARGRAVRLREGPQLAAVRAHHHPRHSGRAHLGHLAHSRRGAGPERVPRRGGAAARLREPQRRLGAGLGVRRPRHAGATPADPGRRRGGPAAAAGGHPRRRQRGDDHRPGRTRRHRGQPRFELQRGADHLHADLRPRDRGAAGVRRDAGRSAPPARRAPGLRGGLHDLPGALGGRRAGRNVISPADRGVARAGADPPPSVPRPSRGRRLPQTGPSHAAVPRRPAGVATASGGASSARAEPGAARRRRPRRASRR